MKKLIALILALMMLCALIPAHAEQLEGGWSVSADSAVTEEAASALAAAIDGMVGADYEAVAVLGTQIVAGTNYCLLCRITPVVPDAVPHYALVYVWQKLDGSAELLEVVDIELGLPEA